MKENNASMLPLPAILRAMGFASLAGLSVALAAPAQGQSGGPEAPSPRPAPGLVLQITVDQLRADLPLRFADRMGEGGLRYLMESGVVYRDATHAHANTETIVGHATLATGAHPSEHGMVGNLWFDRETGFLTYNVEDSAYRLLTAGGGVDDDVEIDPTQRAARSEGRSPRALQVSTFADELLKASGGKARAIGVSVKDRGAISMAGHSGTAYWFSKSSAEFVTSTYYMERYPEWVGAFNAERPAARYAGTRWELLHDRSGYLYAAADDQDWETDVAGFGRTFPHDFGDGSSRYFSTWLTLSPAGDELVVDFACRAIPAERLGEDAVTDYLSVSLSSTDYVGHVFGPSSLEAEDNVLRLDRSIARLLACVDRQVGLDRTLVVLSADHGAPDAPGYLNSLGIPGAYIDPDAWESEPAIQRIKSAFGIEGELIERYAHPYLFLSDKVKTDSGIDLYALEAAIANELSRFDGVWLAVSSTALRRGLLAETGLMRAVLNNFHHKRSGDIYVVFEPHRFINDFDGLEVASTHGSPWRYDSHVPLIFAGAGLKPATVDRQVHTVDVAPTLSTLLGIQAPSGASGRALPEVTGQTPVKVASGASAPRQ